MLHSRREALKTGAAAVGALALGPDFLCAMPVPPQADLLMRTIPSSGEQIPVLGLGTECSFSRTARILDQHVRLLEVLRLFTELGGRLIDAAPTWDPAEGVLTRVTNELDIKDKIFWAGKISIRASGGRDAGMMQFRQSQERLGQIALEQVHDLLRWEVQLPLLQSLKEELRIRYVGVTTSDPRQHQLLQDLLRTERLDFVQLDYAVDNRNAEEALIPMARDSGVAVLVNSAFSRGDLFQRAGEEPVPEWAQAFGAHTWAQVFLKWVLANDDVTAVIPGTSNPEHLRDNMGAGLGRLPSPEERERIAQLVDGLPSSSEGAGRMKLQAQIFPTQTSAPEPANRTRK